MTDDPQTTNDKKTLVGDDAHGGREDLGPADRPERPHDAPIKNQVICAAIKLSDGTIIRGHRHDGCFKYAEQMGIRTPERFKGHVQGFMDARNQFVDRKEGMRIQIEAGIPTVDPRGRGGYHEGNGLFSEDLY